MQHAIYLDYNATAPVRPAVVEAMAAALAEVGNASSIHRFGRTARAAVETAREQVARLVGARPEQVVFTGGGTEANNLALAGAGRERTIISTIEHDSVLRAAPSAAMLPVRGDGMADLDGLAAILGRSDRPTLLSLMLANNETGVIQPVAAAAEIAHAAGAFVHCDAVQAIGKIAVDMSALGVDYLSMSAHKFGGPQGVGALVLAEGAPLAAQLRGGGQERNRRAGTENVAAIVGFGVAAEAAAAELESMRRLAELRDELEHRAQTLVPAALVFGQSSPRLPTTSCLALPGVSSEVQVMALDLAGVAVSAGSACSSGKVRPSHVLQAMGVEAAQAASAIRVSLGWRTTRDDVEGFLAAWSAMASRHGLGAAGSLTAA
jgi:cysteine desulfurase